VYDDYVLKIKKYLPVISDFVGREEPLSEKMIRKTLGVSTKVWNICKKVEEFEEFHEVLKEKESFAEAYGDVLLIKGNVETGYKNPKMIEMYQARFNKNYKPKGTDVEVNLPKIEIEYIDAEIQEEDLEKFDFEPKKEE
jgi:hypothetical protein